MTTMEKPEKERDRGSDSSPSENKGSNRKFIIALIALSILAASMGLSFVLGLKGQAPLLTGGHVITGLALVLGLYGGANIVDKINGGAG